MVDIIHVVYHCKFGQALIWVSTLSRLQAEHHLRSHCDDLSSQNISLKTQISNLEEALIVSKIELSKFAEASILSNAQTMQEKLAQTNQQRTIEVEITCLDEMACTLLGTVSAQKQYISMKEIFHKLTRAKQLFDIEELRSELQYVSRDIADLTKEYESSHLNLFGKVLRLKEDFVWTANTLYENSTMIHQFCIQIQEHCEFSQALLLQVFFHIQVPHVTM